jgi:hypothetical protein
VRKHLEPFYSSTGRPSVDPELMIRMLIVGYCSGIRSERRLQATSPEIPRKARKFALMSLPKRCDFPDALIVGNRPHSPSAATIRVPGFQRQYRLIVPPSTRKSNPVIISASSDARNTTLRA